MTACLTQCQRLSLPEVPANRVLVLQCQQMPAEVAGWKALSSRTLFTHQSCGGHAGLELLRIWCLNYWHCTGTASPRPKKLPVLWFIVLTQARWKGKFKQSLKQHAPQPMRSFGRKDVKKCYSYATHRYSSCKEMFKTGSEELLTWAHNHDRHQETYIDLHRLT